MSAPAFRVLAADPPWAFRDALPGETRGAARQYRTMDVAEIMRFPLPPIAADSWLLLWYVTAMIDEARRVCRAWGFTPTGAELVWVKTTKPGAMVMDFMDPESGDVKLDDLEAWGVKPTKLAFGMGHTVRNCNERVIIARRGKPEVASRSIRSVFFAPVGEHSEKPDRFYALVEALCGAGPRAELFARRHRPGWTCFGDELPEVAP